MVDCCLHPGFGGLHPSSPHSLMKAMEQWVEASVAETHSGMSETTKEMIQESIVQGRLNSYSRDFLKENNQLQEITRDLKIRVDLLENREKMANCMVCNCKVPASTGMGDTAGWRGDGRLGTPLLPCLSPGRR